MILWGKTHPKRCPSAVAEATLSTELALCKRQDVGFAAALLPSAVVRTGVTGEIAPVNFWDLRYVYSGGRG